MLTVTEQIKRQGFILSDEETKLVTELDGILAAANDEGYLSGSCRYGGLSSQSDIDIVIQVDQRKVVPFLSVKPSTELEGSFGSLRWKNNRINLITLSNNQFRTWRLVTNMMCLLPVIEDKQKRRGAFEMLCGLVELTADNGHITDLIEHDQSRLDAFREEAFENG